VSSHPLSIPYGATVACWFTLAHHAPTLSCPLDVVVGVWEVLQPTVSLRCNLLRFQCGFGCFLTSTHFLSLHGGHLKCESENFGPSKFRGEEIWLQLEF